MINTNANASENTNELIVFGGEIDTKISNLINYQDKLTHSFLFNLKSLQKLTMNDFKDTNIELTNDDLEKLNKIKFDGFRNNKYLLAFSVMGLLYCILHTRKLFKMNVNLLKSLYAWGFYLTSLTFSFAYINKVFQNKLEETNEQIMIQHIFPDEYIKYGDLIKKQLNFYKLSKLKY